MSLVLPIVTAAVVLGGCSASSGQNEDEPSVERVTEIAEARQIVLPFDAYLAFRNRWNAPDRAINMLGHQCMQRFGLEWPIIESSPPDTESIDNSRRYGLFDSVLATRQGYHPDESVRSWKPVQLRDPTAQERAVWAGAGMKSLNNQQVPEKGCAGEAMRRLEEGAPKAPALDIQQMDFRSHKFAETDSRVVAAMAKWSECMKHHGFRYDTPYGALDDPTWWGAASASQPEIETARADVSCKVEVNLVGVFYSVEVAYQKRLIEENAEQFATLKSYYDILVRNATAMVSKN